MRKALLIFCALIMPQLAAGQNPTQVTGTVTDVASIAYYPALVQACLAPVTTDPVVNGQHINTNTGTNYCVYAQTTPAGSFLMSLPSNASITNAPGTQYTFTVTSPGTGPPLGTGQQSCAATVTISGTSQDVSSLFNACPKLSNGGVGTPGGASSQTLINNNGLLGGTPCQTFPSLATGPVNNNCDSHFKGPNPYIDLANYGVYLGGFTPPSITCATTAGSTSVTCSGGTSDFAAGQGVSIPLAGPAPTVITPNTPVGISTMSVSSNVATFTLSATMTATKGTSVIVAGASDSSLNGTYTSYSVINAAKFTASVTHADCNPCNIGSAATVIPATPATVTPIEQVGGSTTWNYIVAAQDFNGAWSAGSAPFSTTAGMATLGVQTYTIAANGCSYNSATGLVTFTTTAPHNIPNSPDIEIFTTITGSVGLSGSFVTAGAPTSTTVTIAQWSAQTPVSCPSGGTLQVVAKNFVRWTPQPYNAMRYAVWRAQGAGAYSLVAILPGQDSSFTDWGFGALTIAPADAAYLSATPLAAPKNGYLATTITAINGNTLTLANAATASVASATVLHDNAANIMNACNSRFTAGVDLWYPSVPGSISIIVINSPLKLYSCSAGQQHHILNAVMQVNQPIIPASYSFFEGRATGNNNQIPSFTTLPVEWMICATNPCFLQTFKPSGGNVNSISYQDIFMAVANPYFSGLYLDEDASGAGFTDITLTRTSITGTRGSIPLHMGGGFDLLINGGTFGVAVNGNDWGYPPVILDTVNKGLGQNQQGLMYLSQFRNATLEGGEFLFDAGANLFFNNAGTQPGVWDFSNILIESSQYPAVHLNIAPNMFASGFKFLNFTYADSLGLIAPPVVELGDSRVDAFNWESTGATCANGSQAGVSAIPSTTQVDFSGGACVVNLSSLSSRTNSSYVAIGAATIEAANNANIGYALATPSIAGVTQVAGSLASGTYYYQIYAVDINGNVSKGSAIMGPFTSNGSQALQITVNLVAGQVSTELCRGHSPTNIPCADTLGAGKNFQGTVFTDNQPDFRFTISNGPNFLNANGAFAAAGQSPTMGVNGLGTPNIYLTGGGFTSLESGTFTATRTRSVPDLSVISEVSGYVNTAYDTFNRANGGLGSNWTTYTGAAGGLSIVSHQVADSTASGSFISMYTGAAFANDQFSQYTVTQIPGAAPYTIVLGVRMNSANGGTMYICNESPGANGSSIARVAGVTATTLTTFTLTPAVGDVLRCEVRGSFASGGNTITFWKNGSVVATFTDSGTQGYDSGVPGAWLFQNAGGTVAFDNWSGGNLHPFAHLDSEQDWTQPQHGVAFYADRSAPCAASQFAISAGWGTTAAVSSVAGYGQTCRITITASGTGQAANPTITWTLPVPITMTVSPPIGTAQMTGGTGTLTMISQTTISAPAPVWTFQGTPGAGSTYIVDLRMGP